jgi:hypothetical protein
MNAKELGLCRSDYTERNRVANASERLHQLSKDNQFNDQTISGQNVQAGIGLCRSNPLDKRDIQFSVEFVSPPESENYLQKARADINCVQA